MLRKVLLALALALALSPASAQQNTNVLYLSSPTVTCAASATLRAAARYRSSITISPPAGATTIYVGYSSAVTTSTGFPLVAGSSLTLQPYNGAVYCITASGTQAISPLESF